MKENIYTTYCRTSTILNSSELDLDDEVQVIEGDIHHLHRRIEMLHSHLGTVHHNSETLEMEFNGNRFLFEN